MYFYWHTCVDTAALIQTHLDIWPIFNNNDQSRIPAFKLLPVVDSDPTSLTGDSVRSWAAPIRDVENCAICVYVWVYRHLHVCVFVLAGGVQ